MSELTAIIGAGPAGLTAAAELTRLGRRCVVLEADPVHVGGIARTETYRGYRFDIGGHRFFTKNAEIDELWRQFLPETDFVRVRRSSRIYYRGKYFAYPLAAGDALRKLGLVEAARCGLSYLAGRLRRAGEEVSFEDWVANRFGHRLYEIFFKTYTEKVWGMPCSEISADWAAQRIKGLSLVTAVRQALLGGRGEVVKTLIEEFHYPRLGPGMMWELVAKRLGQSGVPVHLGSKVVALEHANGSVYRLVVERDGSSWPLDVEHVISTMPMRSLVRGLDPAATADVRRAAEGLRYRDFLIVVLILDRVDVFSDNWIYVHDPGVSVGRIQNFKNWSPEMVPDPTKTCLGLEYFCSDGDGLWSSPDGDLMARGVRELEAIGLADSSSVVDGTVLRMRKAYPVYDHEYRTNVEIIREWLGRSVSNVQLCGRNGMHKYNNQDHAMMTGLMAARNIAGEQWNQWLVNDDAEYLEEVRESDARSMVPERISRVAEL